MAGTCGTPGLFRNLRHSLRQTATRVLGTTISTLRACCACKRQWMRTSVYTVLPIPMPSAKMPPR